MLKTPASSGLVAGDRDWLLVAADTMSLDETLVLEALGQAVVLRIAQNAKKLALAAVANEFRESTSYRHFCAEAIGRVLAEIIDGGNCSTPVRETLRDLLLGKGNYR